MITKKYSLPLCIISGILLYISFSYSFMWWLTFFAYIPFSCILMKSEHKKGSLLIYVSAFSLFYYVPLVHWLYNLVNVVNVTKAAAFSILTLGILIIAAAQGFYIFISLLFYKNIRNGTIRDAFILACLLSFGECLQRITPLISFPWSQTGVMVAPFTPFIQSASLFGTSFVSFLIILINAMLAYTVLNIRNRKKAVKAFIIALSVFVCNTLYGFIRISNLNDRGNISVLSVQGNFSDIDKWNSTREEILDRYIALTETYAKNDTVLVIWPETAMPVYFETAKETKLSISELANSNDYSIVTGFFSKNNKEEVFNAIYSFEADGTIKGPYSKQKLVPFGEYLPLENIITKVFSGFLDKIGQGSYLTGGNESTILDTMAGKLGGIICYESIFPEVALDNTKNGAQILISPSNDSWFGDSSALYQHCCHNILRATETDRYLISSSNTGITCIISPRGQILCQAKPLIPTAVSGKVSVRDTRTLYSAVKDIVYILYIFVYLLNILNRFSKNIQKIIAKLHLSLK